MTSTLPPPTSPGEHKYPGCGTAAGFANLICAKLESSRSEASSAMEHFLGSVKGAWDSTEVAPEPQPPSVLCSEDSGPRLLPFYPVLGESPGHGGGLDSGLLSSPCWRLRWVYLQNDVCPRAQSTLEPRPALPTVSFGPGAQKKPEASSGEMDPEEEPEPLTHQQLPSTRTTHLATHSWTGRPDSGHPSEQEHPGPPLRAWGRHVRVFSGCLEWIGHTVYSMSYSCCPCIFGSKEF
ncbi:PREDICTED: annexin-2 receptor-like [Odobenus rosmarus divergens]|uniref:Annexin-2 receptor n=1 Tax=Odobenus rosmarus divergens TaxID=9708 RepID=A0A2U3X2S9_ODORO|nr:PREDICTED: annexin-2 receptor [Odobenus rosmarus divergens]XP_004416453.1 PREDICTED: annexin-2 receptor-like [Odobenus rosmarus divergens]